MQVWVSTARCKSTKGYLSDGSKVKSSQPNQSDLPESSDGNSSTDSFPVCPDPNLCCREGCPNCVWIKYAKELENQHKDSDRVVREIEKQIDDPSIKAFVVMQIKDSLSKKD